MYTRVNWCPQQSPYIQNDSILSILLIMQHFITDMKLAIHQRRKINWSRYILNTNVYLHS